MKTNELKGSLCANAQELFHAGLQPGEILELVDAAINRAGESMRAMTPTELSEVNTEGWQPLKARGPAPSMGMLVAVRGDVGAEWHAAIVTKVWLQVPSDGKVPLIDVEVFGSVSNAPHRLQFRLAHGPEWMTLDEARYDDERGGDL